MACLRDLRERPGIQSIQEAYAVASDKDGIVKRVSRLASARPSRIQPMATRSMRELREIRDSHGSAVAAALNGALNVEEYLKLEALSEH